MNLKWLYTSFSGRIPRQRWWIGMIGVAIVGLIISGILLSIMMSKLQAMGDPTADKTGAFWASMMQVQIWVSLALFVILVYPLAALFAKRLNDRNRPRWFLWIFFVPSAVKILLGLLGFSWVMVDMGHGLVPQATPLATVIGIIAFVANIWAFVELGCLKGTAGPNRFGEDPLAK